MIMSGYFRFQSISGQMVGVWPTNETILKTFYGISSFFIIRLWSVWIKTDFTVCRSFFLLELNFFPRLIRGNPLVGQNKQTSWLYSWLVWFCRRLYPNNLSKKTIKIFWISEFDRARLSNHNLITINTVLNNVFLNTLAWTFLKLFHEKIYGSWLQSCSRTVL